MNMAKRVSPPARKAPMNSVKLMLFNQAENEKMVISLKALSAACAEISYKPITGWRTERITPPASKAINTVRIVKRRPYSKATSLSPAPILLPIMIAQALPRPMNTTKAISSKVELIWMAAIASVPM
jgi:hypothetical protein